MKEQITYDIFDKVDIRVGTVISVKKNEKARKPSLVVEVDFGNEIGIKQSSAQITHFYNENNLFTGDTLFSLGCGRIFEGTYEQMFSSLEKIKKLPHKTKIYCGHEYTLQNSKFCIKYDKDNLELIKKINDIKKKLNNNQPTIPTTLEEELKSNIFLRSDNFKVKKNLYMNTGSSLHTFSKLRDLKDNF